MVFREPTKLLLTGMLDVLPVLVRLTGARGGKPRAKRSALVSRVTAATPSTREMSPRKAARTINTSFCILAECFQVTIKERKDWKKKNINEVERENYAPPYLTETIRLF
jgi:hypothetical protein